MSILSDGQSNNRPPTALGGRSGPIRAGLLVIFVLTVVLHTAFGVYFWTAAPTRAPKTSLKYEGEQYLASYPGWNTGNERDAASYNRAVVELRRTGVPRTKEGAFFSKGAVYVYFLAACYSLGGTRLLSVVIPNAMLVGLSGVLIALTARRIARQSAEATAIIAACLVLVNIRFATWAGYIDPFSLILFIYTLSYYLATGEQTPRQPILFAGLIVIGIYTHGAFFLAAAAAALWLLVCFRTDRRRTQLWAAGAIVAGVFVSFPLNAGHGDSLQEDTRALMWQVNNPRYESMHLWSHWEVRLGPTKPEWGMTPEQEQRYTEYIERAGGDRAKACLLWARENPGQYAKFCWLRSIAVLGPIFGYRARMGMVTSSIWWLLVYPAGFYGLWRYRNTRAAGLALLTIGVELLFAVFIDADPRYVAPMYVLLTVYAAMTYGALGGRFFPAEAQTDRGR